MYLLLSKLIQSTLPTWPLSSRKPSYSGTVCKNAERLQFQCSCNPYYPWRYGKRHQRILIILISFYPSSLQFFCFHSPTSSCGSSGVTLSHQPSIQRRIDLNCFASKSRINPSFVSSTVWYLILQKTLIRLEKFQKSTASWITNIKQIRIDCRFGYSSSKRWICKNNIILSFNLIRLTYSVLIFNCRICNRVEHKVHCTYAEHCHIGIVTRNSLSYNDPTVYHSLKMQWFSTVHCTGISSGWIFF